MAVRANRVRALTVFGAIVQAQRDKRYPFSLKSTVTPQHEAHLPPGLKTDPRVYAYFLLVLCYFMRGMDSVTAAKCLGRMYAERPELFTNPTCALDYGQEELGKLIADYGLSFSRNAALSWQDNLHTLQKHWQGDVWNLIQAIDGSYTKACRYMLAHYRKRYLVAGPSILTRGFRGFQHKMVSMYLYYLMSEGLIEPFTCPIPVDFHILRLSIEHMIIRDAHQELPIDYMSNHVLAKVRVLTVYAQRQLGVSMTELCDALWLFGKAMCSGNPGNRTRSGAYNARSTELTPHEVSWTPTQFNSWLRSCGACPVRDTCKLNVPAAWYFRLGKALAHSLRKDPPEDLQASVLFNPYLLATELGSRRQAAGQPRLDSTVGLKPETLVLEFGPDTDEGFDPELDLLPAERSDPND